MASLGHTGLHLQYGGYFNNISVQECQYHAWLFTGIPITKSSAVIILIYGRPIRIKKLYHSQSVHIICCKEIHKQPINSAKLCTNDDIHLNRSDLLAVPIWLFSCNVTCNNSRHNLQIAITIVTLILWFKSKCNLSGNCFCRRFVVLPSGTPFTNMD